MDLFKDFSTTSMVGKRYNHIIIDDYTILNWIKLFKHKMMPILSLKCSLHGQKEQNGCSSFNIHSNHEEKFENETFKNFYDNNEIEHNFSKPKMPQQNGIADQKIDFHRSYLVYAQ